MGDEEMMRWEYLLFELDDDGLDKQTDGLDEFGGDGWELVAVSKDIAYMKRPLLPESD